MEFKTSISKMSVDDHIIRGKKLSNMIAEGNFSDAAYLLLTGRKPTDIESKLFEKLLIACVDHGMGTASALSARFVASAGNSLNASVAAGVLALGDLHGGAAEMAMKQIKEAEEYSSVDEFVGSLLLKKEKIYGFGHRIYKQQDPRVVQILNILSEQKFSSVHVETVIEMERQIALQKGKKIPLNIDGLVAAIFLQFGFTPEMARGAFIIARIPGLIAQAIEENEQHDGPRRLDEEEITYNE